MRGKGRDADISVPCQRITPAHAGKSLLVSMFKFL